MSIASALLNAQRRPEAEARRFTDAVAAALGTGVEIPDASAFLSATETLDRVNEEIAEEKAPRTAAPAAGHVEQFDDHVPETFDDDGGIPLLPSTHRSDARYLLEGSADTGSTGIQELDVTDAADGDSPNEKGGYEDTNGPSWFGDSDVSVEEDVPWDRRVPEPADENTLESASGEDSAGEQITHEETTPAGPVLRQESAAESEVATVSSEDGASEAPRWEWSSGPAAAQNASPWGNAQELVASLPAPAVAPESDDSGGDVTEVAPAPSSRATEPPSVFDEPEPESEPSLVSRVGEALSDHWRQLRVDPKGSAKKIGLVLAAVVLAAVVGLSFMGGGRGKPPDPAGSVAPPPQVENTTPPAKEVTLVPATVSTSCGNDSDAVAPFSGDKTRAWKCNRIDGLDLNVLNLTFDKPVVITSITIVPGFNYIAPDGRDEWPRHRVVTDVSWRMGGGLYPQEHIAPTRTGVTQKFPDVRTLMMSMTITGSARPPVGKASNKGSFGDANDALDPKKVDETTAVSKIVITGYPVESDGGGLTPQSPGK